MKREERYKQPPSLERRRVLRLAAASVLVVGGCANLNRTSDLDASLQDLDTLLAQSAPEGAQDDVNAIARRIESRARDLATEHREFVNGFDRMLAKHSATEAQLDQLIEIHQRRRTWLRNDLLYLQEELRAALSPQDWAQVAKVLNETGTGVTVYTLSEV